MGMETLGPQTYWFRICIVNRIPKWFICTKTWEALKQAKWKEHEMARRPKTNNIKRSLPLPGLQEQREEIMRLDLVHILKIVDLYTSSGWIIWYVNYISIKLWRNEERRENTYKKCVQNLYAEISEVLKQASSGDKWSNIPCSWIGFHIVKMLILPSDSIDLMWSQLNSIIFW